jgi:hypothetical protein
MTSRHTLNLVAALPVLLAACSGVHDLNFNSDPLVVVHGHVDTTALVRTHPDVPLIGALVWAAVPVVNPVCVRFPDDPNIKAACPDPHGVFLGETEKTAPVADDGTFDLALFHLPAFSDSIGDSVTRIAYGTLLVAEDVNGDGNLDLVPAPSRGGFEGPGMQPVNPDLIVAASFSTLDAHQERLAFREGGWIPPCLGAGMMPPDCSYFYPSTCVDAPPLEFSVMVTDPGGACTAVQAETDTIVIEAAPFASAADGHALNCRSVQADGTVRAPPADGDGPPGGNRQLVCLAPKVAAAVYPDICTFLRAYALSGCAQDPLCTAPEWTTPIAPIWWPASCT